MPPSSPRIILLLAAVVALAAFVQLGLLAIAFDKLGLSRGSAYLLLVTTLAGSLINIPLYRLPAQRSRADTFPRQLREFLGLRRASFAGTTVVAVNVGGCITPVAFSFYLLQHSAMHPLQVALAVGGVAAVAFATSRPMPGIGIGMPFLVAPVMAALVASMLNAEQRAPLAYIGGTLGVLIGADLLRLRQIGKLGAPVAAIGGAGTFDGIFLSGLLAVLLA